MRMRRAQAAAAAMALSLIAGVTGCGRRPGIEKPDLTPPASSMVKDLPFDFQIAVFPGVPPASARALAAGPDDRVVVASQTGMHVFTPEGRLEASWSTSAPPTCVAVGASGRIYAGIGRQVVVFDASGRRLTDWTEPDQLKMPVDIAVAEPEVFVADAENRCIYHFAENGDFIDDIARRDPEGGEEGLIVPSPHLPVTIAGEDLLAVGDPGRRAVQIRRFSGEQVRTWGRAGLAPGRFSGCCNPVALAWIPEPTPMIVTAEKGARRVQAFSLDGRLLAYIGPEHFADSAGPLDLAAGKRLFLLDAPARKILVLTPVRRTAGARMPAASQSKGAP